MGFEREFETPILVFLEKEEAMKEYEKLDKTLQYLIDNTDPYGMQSTEIHNELKVATDAVEQHLILEKLVKDGYSVIHVPKNKETGEEYRNDSFCIASYDGIVFRENNGYKVEYAIRNRELINRKIISWLNPAWKIILFISAILTLFFGSIKAYTEIITPIFNT